MCFSGGYVLSINLFVKIDAITVFGNTATQADVCVCVLRDSGYHAATADHLPSSHSVTCLSAAFTASFTTSVTLRTLFSNKKKSEICFNAEFLIHLWEIATSPQNNVC